MIDRATTASTCGKHRVVVAGSGGDTAAPLPWVHGATATYLDRDSRGAVRP